MPKYKPTVKTFLLTNCFTDSPFDTATAKASVDKDTAINIISSIFIIKYILLNFNYEKVVLNIMTDKYIQHKQYLNQ